MAVLRIVRYVAFALIGVLVLVWAAVGLGWFAREEVPEHGLPTIAKFQLTDQDGQSVDERAVLGKPALVFFGFTYCPDVCPTTLAAMTALLGRLGSDGDRLGVFFVTVDPERDTSAEVKKYLSSFDRRIRGLTGTHDQIRTLAKPLGVFFAKVKSGDSYTMDHTASVFLLDTQGRFRGTIAYGEDAGVAEDKVRALLR
jgi:protein SCO1/2